MKVPSVLMIMNGRRQAAQRRFLKRGVIRRCLTFGLVAALGLMVAVPASAAGTPDANNQAGTTSSMSAYGGSSMLAQTFTALTAGSLDQVDLPLGTAWNGAGHIYIVPLSATGKPSSMRGTSVGTYGPYLSCCAAYGRYPIAPAYNVAVNGHYAIVVVPNIGTAVIWGVVRSASYDYTGGQLWYGNQPSTWSYNTSMGYDFDFITYVTPTGATPPPPANSAPSIKANLAAVQVTEGAVPTASGTYGDSDNDTVTLSASALTGAAGTVTPGSTPGTWLWTGVAADEGQGQTITITADDGHGNKSTAQFTTVVLGVAPTAKISGAPASAREGTTITLSATATSPSAEDNAAPFTYAWSATDYDSQLPGGSGASYSLKTDDEGVYKVTLIATDESGHASPSVSVTINGVDATPVASITSTPQGFVIVPQQSLSFTGTFTDAGSVVDTSYTTTWSWGDGTSTASSSHAYASAGTYTVTYRAADDDGTAGSATTTVTVLTPAAAMAKIASLVSSQTGLNKGQMNSLMAKMNAAEDSWQRGNAGPACNQLGAFVNEVDADQKAGRISSGDATTMTDAAHLTQRSMGCFRTLVEFLSGL